MAFPLTPMLSRKFLKVCLKTNKRNITHHQVNASAGEGFTYNIERIYNSIRDKGISRVQKIGKRESINERI